MRTNPKLYLAFRLIVTFLSIPGLSAGENNLAPAYFEDSLNIGGKTCSIKLKKSFATLAWKKSGEKLEFSVYCNGKFMHSSDIHGGTVIGHQDSYTPYTRLKDINPIEKLILNGRPRGWILKTLIDYSFPCKSSTLILPTDFNYKMKTYISDLQPVIRQHLKTDNIEVWYSTTRYHVPIALFDIIIMNLNDLGTPSKLPDNFNEWPDAFKPNYEQAFVAGMMNKNTKVLETARNLLNESNYQKETTSYGVPHTKKKLDEVINAMKTLEKANVFKYLDSAEWSTR